jgi:hypothetical protein
MGTVPASRRDRGCQSGRVDKSSGRASCQTGLTEISGGRGNRTLPGVSRSLRRVINPLQRQSAGRPPFCAHDAIVAWSKATKQTGWHSLVESRQKWLICGQNWPTYGLLAFEFFPRCGSELVETKYPSIGTVWNLLKACKQFHNIAKTRFPISLHPSREFCLGNSAGHPLSRKTRQVSWRGL